MEIGDREAQTPSSSIAKKISGSVSPWPESALAAVRDEVVWTGDRDAQTSPSISANKNSGRLRVQFCRAGTTADRQKGQSAHGQY